MYNRDKLKKHFWNKVLINRLSWTVVIIFIYMFGKYLPIATIPFNEEVKLNTTGKLVENLLVVSGGQLSRLTLFSLGLSPWMTSMILWRFVTVFKIVKNLTTAKSNAYRLGIMLVVALIQAYGFSAVTDYFTVSSFGDQSQLILRLATMGILMAGAFVLMWLGNLNAQYGIGGSSVIIISNMILTFLINLQSYLAKAKFDFQELLSFLGILLLVISLLVAVTVMVYRAEYRIPMRRISIISRYAEKTYLPIRLTPAGGMPFMYAMTLMILPPLLVGALSRQFPDNTTLSYLASHMNMSHLLGILVYVAMLFILAIGFAFFNTDPVELAESMRKNGDYIENVRPGEETRQYITNRLWKLALLGAIYTTLMGGLPMIIVWSQGGEMTLPLLITNIYIVTSLMLGMVEQVSVLQSWRAYKELI